VSLDGTMDDPVGALDAHVAAVEEHECPLHFQVIFGNAYTVAQGDDEAEQLAVFEVGDLTVGEGGFLVFESD